MTFARLIVLGIAVAAAVVAAFLARGLVSGEREPAPQTVAAAPKAEIAEVLVVTRDVPIGTFLESGALAWASWPKDAVRDHMITRAARPEGLEDFAKAVARASLYEGEPIVARKLVMPDQGGFMAAILPEGMRAISVRISPETGAGGFILPNDRVDVILTRRTEREAGEPRQTSETVLANVRVLAIDQSFQESGSDDQAAIGKTATLELTPEQSEVLALAEATGQLTLALRSLADNTAKDGPKAIHELRGQPRRDITIVRYGVGSKISTGN